MMLIVVAPGLVLADSGSANGKNPTLPFTRYVVAAESYGQGIWYAARLSYRFNRLAMANAGYSYLSIPPGNSGGATAAFHLLPVSLSAMWPLAQDQPFFAEILFGGNFVIGDERTARTGVRATATGQAFTPVVGFGVAYFPDVGGIVVRTMCYLYQGIDSIGIESRRLPWLGGSVGYSF
ncbi:hypothetical protein [Turneriella parva]|uniref:Outer membrane protein beta-barrel domain-containing protein n=1 Tax=Turneriella parva (strain ATCC BAA-1111 / DSM 21527 / NCTC 11395 / H) TaxID=869212 RepID=I4BAD5_TURPD|nr:hypothetical protein [Turneriella parva]AFM14242.1 hypothetical protein Turpa_3608 [Turneriella parva DSM 21527]